MKSGRRKIENPGMVGALVSSPANVESERSDGIDHQRVLKELRQVNEQLVVAGIHEQELAEFAQRQAAQWATLLDSLTDGVIVANDKGELVVANPVARSLLELPMQGPLTQSGDWLKLDLCRHDGRKLPVEERPLARAIRGERFSDYEVLLVRRDGTQRRIDFNGSSVCDLGGAVVLAIVVLRDVTVLRMLEKLRDEYIFIISHDLRAPLTIILGRSDLLLRTARKNQLPEFAQESEIIMRNARKMNVMIQDLLETARLEAGEVTFHRKPLDLADVIRGAIETSVPPKDLSRIELHLPTGLSPVQSDRSRIERVIMNFLSNALKYSPPDTPVDIELSARDGEEVVSVIDHGIGIAPEALPHVFDRYYRATAGRRGEEGLGLGLYSSRLIVERAGGRIWATSQPGRGSTFSFSLPVG